MELLKTLIVFASVLACGESLKILGVFGYPGQTHFNVFRPLLEALAERGHEVTVLGYFPSNKKLPRYKDIALKYPGDSVQNTIELENVMGGRRGKYSAASVACNFGKSSCEINLPSKEFHDLLESQEQFDLIISEYFNSNCFLTPLVEKFKCPFIGITSHVLLPWTNDWVENPDHPGYIPEVFIGHSDQMSFLERVENTLVQLYHKMYFKFVVENDEFDMVKKYVGKEMSHADDIMYNTSLILVNSHFSLHRPRPLVPNVVEIGGIHLGKNQKLPAVCNLSVYSLEILLFLLTRLQLKLLSRFRANNPQYYQYSRSCIAVT